MSPVRTAYVPWFSSQLCSSQRDEAQPEQQTEPEPPCQGQRGKRGNKRGNANVRKEKNPLILKVKLPKFNKKVTPEDKTTKELMVEQAARKPETTVSRGGGGEQCDVAVAGTYSDPVAGDVFVFSQRSISKAVNENEKAKLAVLRTISKVLEENQLIRQRLATLSQAN